MSWATLEMVGSAEVPYHIEEADGIIRSENQETSTHFWLSRRTKSSRLYGGSCTAWSSARSRSMGPVSHAWREAGGPGTHLPMSFVFPGTGEHGVGIGKREFLVEELGAGTVALMKTIKHAIDPLGIMNPGKVRPCGCACALWSWRLKIKFSSFIQTTTPCPTPERPGRREHGPMDMRLSDPLIS